MGQVMFAEHKNNLLNGQAIMGMYRLRHKIFYERMGWQVRSIEGMERDEFDHANPIYVLVKDEDDQVIGCCRLLPTTGPYMLKDTFPQLLYGQPAPQQEKIWEVSRFAVDTEYCKKVNFGFSEVSLDLIRAVARFAQENGIQRLVAAVSVEFERMFRGLGVHINRLGEGPMQIGKVRTVAIAFEIDEITNFALFGSLPHVERLAA